MKKTKAISMSVKTTAIGAIATAIGAIVRKSFLGGVSFLRSRVVGIMVVAAILFPTSQVLFPISQVLAKDITGVWLVPKEGTHIKVTKCGSGYCGKISKLADPTRTDIKNVKKSLRSRRLQGLQLFKMSKKIKKNQWEGSLYNPRDGKTYTGKLTYNGKNKVSMKGCVMGGLICRGQSLTRIK